MTSILSDIDMRTATFPAITVWQPWASLIARGDKPYEFRSRPCPSGLVDQTIAIHAGARRVDRIEVWDLLVQLRAGKRGTALLPSAVPFLEEVYERPTMLATSCVVCLARLGAPRRPAELFRGGANDSDRVAHSVWAWPLSDIRQTRPQLPARGQQGWWSWKPGQAVDLVPVRPGGGLL